MLYISAFCHNKILIENISNESIILEKANSKEIKYFSENYILKPKGQFYLYFEIKKRRSHKLLFSIKTSSGHSRIYKIKFEKGKPKFVRNNIFMKLKEFLYNL